MDRKLQIENINELLGTKFQLNKIDKINFIENILNKIEVKTDEKNYPNIISFFYDDLMYMELNTINHHLWCSNQYIWSILTKEFMMEYIDIHHFIKGMVEQYFNIGSVNPIIGLILHEQVSEDEVKEWLHNFSTK